MQEESGPGFKDEHLQLLERVAALEEEVRSLRELLRIHVKHQVLFGDWNAAVAELRGKGLSFDSEGNR